MSPQRVHGIGREVFRVGKGAVLMREGETGKCAYFVLEGRLLVERDFGGKKEIVAEIGVNDIVGELAILDDEPRSATVIAAEDSTLLVLDKSRIHALIRHHPKIAEVVLKLLCRKLRTAHYAAHKNIDLQSPECWRRIGAILCLCAEVKKAPQDLFISFFDNIKALTDIPLQRIGLVLERLEKTGAVRTNGEQIEFVDQAMLRSFLLHCNEEFIEQDFPQPTPSKQYQALQVLTQYCRPVGEEMKWVDLPRKGIVELLASSDLWKTLSPAMQMQRAEEMLQCLTESGAIAFEISSPETLRIYFDKIEAYPKPKQEIEAFQTMKAVLFRPVS
ncbi:MAG: Crp/Fnr family transcriptional regulator [Candidatus Omnitrophota bacterium]